MCSKILQFLLPLTVIHHLIQELLDISVLIHVSSLESLLESRFVHLALDDHSLLASDLSVVTPGSLDTFRQANLIKYVYVVNEINFKV